MSGASPFFGYVMALFTNGRLAILASGIQGDAAGLVDRINSGSMNDHRAAFTASIIAPAEPLPEVETAGEDERRDAVDRLGELLERMAREPLGMADAHRDLMDAFKSEDWAKHFDMTADEDGVHLLARPEPALPLPVAGGGWNPAAADRLRRKNKRRGKRV